MNIFNYNWLNGGDTMQNRLTIGEYMKIADANKAKYKEYEKRYEEIKNKIDVKWYKLQDSKHIVMHFKIPSEKSKLMYDTLIEFYTAFTDANSLKRAEIKVFSNCPSWVYMNARVAKNLNMDIDWANDLFNKETLKPPEEGKEDATQIRLEKALAFAIIHIKRMDDITLMSKAKGAFPMRNGSALAKFIRNADWIMEKRGQAKSEQDFMKLLQKFSPVKVTQAQTKRAGMSTSKTTKTTKISSTKTKSVAKTKKI